MKQLVIFILTIISITHVSYCSISNINLNVKENSLMTNRNKILLENTEKNQIKSLGNLNLNVKEQIKAGSNLKNLYSLKTKLHNYNSDNFKLSKPKTITDMFKTSKSSKKSKGKKHKKGKKIPKNKILWEGWLKFISITDKQSPKTPNKFFVNPEYSYQKIYKKHLKKKDKKGYLNVKDRFQFFATLKSDGLFIYKNRKYAFGKNVEEIKIKDIRKINEKKLYSSSVREIEDFQNNFCLKIKTKYPINPKLDYDEKTKGHKQDFILCMDKKKERNKILKFFVKLKLSQQEYDEKMKKKKLLKAPTKPKHLKKKIYDKPKNWVPKDGYWILLQDWTTCSLKCGGGTSYQQWMCVPPKKGGRKCQGKPVRTRPCNTQPCPGTKCSKTKKSKNGNKVLKPIIKSMPFSKRPQNYIKCQIKEYDVFYMTIMKLKSGKNKNTKRPARLIMNTHTISIYNDDNYKNSVFSFELKRTAIAPKKSQKCCFELQNSKDAYTICGGFGQPCGGNTFVNQWIKDFNLFKTGCYENLKIKLWKKSMAKRAIKNAMDAAGLGGLNDRAKLLQKKVHEKQMDQWNKNIQKTQNTAMKAMKREFDIEKMLQQELQLKAELESKKLVTLKKREQKKKECLLKALKSRDQMNKDLLDKLHKQQKLKAIKLTAKKEVQNQRNKLREKLNEIRNKFKRRKRLIEQDINVIRAEMAKNLVDANKDGNMLICKNSYGNKKKIETYCNRELVENYVKNVECKTETNFCYVCCENEFGNMKMDKRGICYKMCDKMMNSILDDGEFYWV